MVKAMEVGPPVSLVLSMCSWKSWKKRRMIEEEEEQSDVAVPRDIVEDLEEEEQSQLEAQLKEAYGQVEI